MKHANDRTSETGQRSRSAAEWFVALDQGRCSDAELSRFEAWLNIDPDNAAAFARCAQAFRLATAAGTHSSAAARPAAGATPRPTVRLQHLLVPLARPAIAWSVTAIALLTAATGWLRTPHVTEPVGVADEPAAPAEHGESWEPMHWASDRIAVEPVVLRPGHVVVDALSVGVQSFRPVRPDADADRRAADELYRQFVGRLSQVPGTYVVGADRTDLYTSIDSAAAAMDPVQVAAQLGVRSIIEASVLVDHESVRLNIRMIDASIDATRVSAEFVGTLGEFDTFLHEIVQQMTDAMTEPLSAAVSPLYN